LAGVVAALAVGVPAAAGNGNPVLVVTPPAPCCSGQAFAVQTLDGTVTSSVAVPDGTEPIEFGVAADGAIAFNDASQGAGGQGPLWLVGPNRTPLELDSSAYDFDASITYDGSKVTFARYDPATDSSNIYVVGADGSGLTRVAAGLGDDYLSSPKFSPDGGSISYYCRPGNTPLGSSLGCGPTVEGTYANSGVMLMNADGSDKRMIVMGSAGVGDGPYSWSPDGQSLTGASCIESVVDNVWSCGPTQAFAYGTDGNDLFKPEDPSLEITHEPLSTGVYDPQFTPDGNQLLFMKIVDNAWALYGIDRDGEHEQPTALAPQASFGIVPPATGGSPLPTVNLTKSGGNGIGPIVVGSGIFQCHVLIEIAANGTYTRCISFPATSDAAVYAPAADGSIVFSDIKAGTGGDGGPVWLIKSNGQAVELDPSPNDFDPSISHDGSKVTFARLDPATSSSDIYTISSDGSGRTVVASGGGTSELSTPTFSPDGGSIAYSCGPALGPGGMGCGPLLDGTHRANGVMLMNADGSDKRMILVGLIGPMSWSPDGKWLAMTHCVTHVVDNVSSCDAEQVFAYRTDGSDVFNADDPSRQVTHADSIQGGVEPQFTPDGSQILFLRNVDGSGDSGSFAYVVNRDGTGDHELSLTPDPPECTGNICDFGPTWGTLLPSSGGGGPSATVKATHASVPAVRALSYRAARRRLAAVDLAAKIAHRSFSSRIKRGHVIAQYPRARARTNLRKKRGRVVRLVLSRGKRPSKR
jgi:Tol biopolymer transport system component